MKEEERKHLQTVVSGCAWCKKIIDVANHEVDVDEKWRDTHLLLSHGICLSCKEKFEEEK